MSGVYTIPPTLSFVDALAQGVMTRVGNDPLKLAEVTILLPNRRAVRNLREAFLRRTGGRPTLLPAIRPLGDVDEDALALGPGIEHLSDQLPINPLRRQLVLAQYLHATDSARYSLAQALPMAAELGRFLDSVHTEGLSLDNLDALVPAEYAAHWGQVLGFLKKVVGVYWPRQLEKENALDPGAYRAHMLAAYTDMLRETPPTGLMIGAGSTGSIPATAELLKTIAELPNGMVVLPGLDTVLDDESWNTHIEEGHPQAGLQRLLATMNTTRAEVGQWVPHTQTPREHLISTLMRPAATLARWTSEPTPEGAFDNLAIIEAESLDAEATAVAAIMREHAQDTEAKEPCVLVTPDRTLATRVAHTLARWNIAIDDSAGIKLHHTAPGAWLLLLARVLDNAIPPVELLAALKHPLAAGGRDWPKDAPPYRNFVRLLDRYVLRGARPAPGFDGLHHRLRNLERMDEGLKKSIAAGLRALEKIFAPAAITQNLPERIRALVLLAQDLAATPDETGAQRLWAGDAGEAAANMFSALFEQNDVMPEQGGWDIAHAVLESAMEGVSIRPRFGTHPRLAILGPIEARLYQASTMILGGLNEGAWPRMAEVDGWMSRPMRRDFGLPAPERAITLSAHDFTQGLGAANVIITRSKTRDGAPAIPSRWLQRLDAVCTAQNVPDLRARGARWLDIAARIDAATGAPTPTAQPVANPPLAARPRKLRVTEISKLRADPYGIYARHVLGLAPLDPIDAEPDARDRGTLIHAALEEYARAFPRELPDNAYKQLVAMGEKVFEQAHAHPDVYGHWWPRFQRMARALIDFESSRRHDLQSLWPEAEGEMQIPMAGGDPFTLKGRADRIERRDDGWSVIDYKSGSAPAAKGVASGDEPQLTLLGAMLLQGAFNASLGITATPDHIATLAYWPAGGTQDVFTPANIKGKDNDLDALCRAALEGLEKTIRAYLEDGIPYICWPDAERKLRDDYEYAHLGRIAEWSGEEDEAA